MIEESLATESAMEALGGRVGAACTNGGALIYLQGELGTGKTTLVRGLLHRLGHRGPVKSPTFTLVEPYDFGKIQVYHFDLYRVNNQEELENIGLRDYFAPGALCLVEWPERGAGLLPPADLHIGLFYAPTGRRACYEAHTARGKEILSALDRGSIIT